MKFIVKEENEDIYNKYLDNNGRKLDKLCKYLIRRKNMPQMYDDDLYGVAIDVFMESINTYDKNNGYEFHTYLQGNIWRAFYDWTRDNFYRGKRCNLQLDKDGNILRLDKDGNVSKDGKGNPIIIQNISLDEKMEDDLGWSEKIESDFDLEEELSDEFGLSKNHEDNYSPEMKEYLNKLSNVQVKVLTYLSEGYSKEEIENILHINSVLYNDSIAAITSERNRRCIRSLIRRKQSC